MTNASLAQPFRLRITDDISHSYEAQPHESGKQLEPAGNPQLIKCYVTASTEGKKQMYASFINSDSASKQSIQSNE